MRIVHEGTRYRLKYIDLAKPKSGARIFFSRTSQGHNALPRPGLELGSSDSEPSALTTGPRMLKVAPCTVGRTVVSPNFFGLMGYYYYFV